MELFYFYFILLQLFGREIDRFILIEEEFRRIWLIDTLYSFSFVLFSFYYNGGFQWQS